MDDNAEEKLDICEIEKSLAKKAYDTTNPNREKDKEKLIELILGTYLGDLEKKARILIQRYRVNTEEPGDIVHEFVLIKLYEKDALKNYLNYDYKNMHQFLYSVFKNYFIDEYIRKKEISCVRESDFNESTTMDDSEEKQGVSTLDAVRKIEERELDPVLADFVEEEELKSYNTALKELSEAYPFDVNLYKKIYKEEMSYLDVVREDGEFNFVNILVNYGKNLEKIVLPNSKIGFKDKKAGNILSEDEAMQRAIDFLKKRIERIKGKLGHILQK